MVPVHRVLHHPRYPGSHVTFPIWADHGHQNLCPRMYYRPASFSCLIFEQSQRMVYIEVLIAGDLSQHDVNMATKQLGAFQVSWQLI